MAPILERMATILSPGHRLLEIGSGTGEHAVAIAAANPGVTVQTSDADLSAMGLPERIARSSLPNLLDPIALDIAHWPSLRPKFDVVLAINCIHIAPESLLPSFAKGAARSLRQGGLVALYGPFRYGGMFDTPSNEAFDRFLRETYPGGGIRDFETVDGSMAEAGLRIVSDTEMPANNRFIVWRRT